MIRGWKVKTLTVIAAVAAALVVSAAPAAASTSVGLAVYKQGGSSSPTQLNADQYIWNDVVELDAYGSVTYFTHLWLIVQTDGNLVLYKQHNGVTSVCWAVNVYQTNAPTPKLVFTSNGTAQLWWGSTLKWSSGPWSGNSIDISGWTGQLYIGNHIASPVCY